MRTCISAFVALAAIVGLGCQNSTAPSSQSMAAPQRAVIVSGGNGGHTVLLLPSENPSHPTMLSTSGGPVCADCEAAAAKYFQGGALETKCPSCGGTRIAATGTIPNYGHN